MKILFGYIKKHWFIALLGPLFMLLEVAMDLLQPMFMASIIDEGVMLGNYEHIIKLAFYMIGAAILGLIGGVGCTIFASIASMRFGHDVRQDAYTIFNKLQLKQMDKLQSGSVITRLTNDIIQIQNMVAMLLRVLVRSPLLLIGSLIMAVYISLRLSIIVAIAVPLLFLVMWVIIRKTLPLFSHVQQKLDRMNTVLQENLLGIRASKVFVRADFETKRFVEANDGFTSNSIKAQALMALNGPLLTFILNISIVAVLLCGGRFVIDGSFEVGLLIAYINYVVQLLNAVSSIANNLVRLSSAKVSADRVVELLVLDTSLVNEHYDKQKIKGNITFKDVSFNYNSKASQDTLKHINLNINAGSKVAIIGATGSGKTTLVSLLPVLYKVTDGEILIDHKPIETYDVHALRKQISYVLQDLTIFSGTIAFNIAFGKPNATTDEIRKAAQIACIDDYIEGLPNQYDTVIGEKGVNLSGGQKQRLAIARAIIEARPIIIFDDSTSAIDMRTEAKILEQLKQHCEQSTLIIVAQKISSVMDAEQIIVLDNGEIIAVGTHDNLLKNEPTYQDIYRSQLGNEVEVK